MCEPWHRFHPVSTAFPVSSAPLRETSNEVFRTVKKLRAVHGGRAGAFLWKLLDAALAPAPDGLADTDRRILDAVTGFGRAVCERRLNAAARTRARGRSGFRKRTVLSLF